MERGESLHKKPPAGAGGLRVEPPPHVARAARHFHASPTRKRGTSRPAKNVSQRAAAAGEIVNAYRDGRILFDRGRVVRLEPRVDDERPTAAPVLLVHRRIDAMHVGRRV